MTKEQFVKVAKGFFIAFFAAGAVKGLEMVMGQDFGENTVLIQAFAGALINVIKVAAKL